MEDNESLASNDYQLISWKSWTAFVRPMLFSSIFVLLLAPAAWQMNHAISLLFAIFGLAYGTYSFFTLRSYRLYANDAGVWVYGGVLPWTKGAHGVKWRDLDSASYTAGFASWLFKSHTIHVGHRYTKASEILLTHMAFGPDAVMTINERQNAQFDKPHA